MQMDEKNDMMSRELSAKQFMNPGPSGGAHEASHDETQDLSTSLNNNSTIGVGQKESAHNMVSIARKRPFVADESDQSPHSWEANKSLKLAQPRTTDEATTEYPCRKARVSVRARSDAPMVSHWIIRNANRSVSGQKYSGSGSGEPFMNNGCGSGSK